MMARPRPRTLAASSGYQQGSSLLEVMVALMVMAFGLLGMAAMTGRSLQYTKGAQFQTAGAQLAAAYGDRIRANIAGYTAGGYDQVGAYTAASGAVTVPACADAASCSPAEMAAVDVAEWTNLLRRSLPAGGAYVARDAGNPLAADLWLMWAEPGAQGSDLGVAGGNACPAEAMAGKPADLPVPHCLYFRVTL